MCESKAEGGKRCDAHHPAKQAVIDTLAITAYNGSNRNRDLLGDTLKTWNELRNEPGAYPEPTAKEFAEFVKSEKHAIYSHPGIPVDKKKALMKKLDSSLKVNTVSGKGFYALQHLRERINSKEKLRQDVARQAAADRLQETRKRISSTRKPYDGTTYNEEYSNWPVPQADNLDKLSTVVDSINGGANTADSIGEAIGAVDRQGSYYANAAGYIGLVEKHKDDIEGTQYHLTMAGQQFLALPPEQRTQMLQQMVEATPVMQSYREGGDSKENLVKTIQQDGGYEETVARRRAATINTWADTLSKSDFSSALSQQQQETVNRAISASKNQAEAREKKKNEMFASSVQKHGEICSSCFMTKNLKGVCDNCD
jgi:hypothetical protein